MRGGEKEKRGGGAGEKRGGGAGGRREGHSPRGVVRSWDNGRHGGGPLQQGALREIPGLLRGRAGCEWALGGRCGPPTRRTCQTDLDAGAVPARPGVRHLPPTIGQPRIQCRRPPARPGPAPPPPPPQGYGSGLGAGVRAGIQTPRPRRPGGGRMLEPGNQRSTRRPRPSLVPSPAQSGAAAAFTTSEPDARRPRRFRRHLPEPRALSPPCRPGPARARALRPRACVRARPRGARRGGARRVAALPAQPRARGISSLWSDFPFPPSWVHPPPPRGPGGGDQVPGAERVPEPRRGCTAMRPLTASARGAPRLRDGASRARSP